MWTVNVCGVWANRQCLDLSLCVPEHCYWLHSGWRACGRLFVLQQSSSPSSSPHPLVVHHKTLQGTVWWLAGTPWELHVWVWVCVCFKWGVGGVCVCVCVCGDVSQPRTRWCVYCTCCVCYLCMHVCFIPAGNMTPPLAFFITMLWMCLAAVQQP